jgi:alpha-mannosidase
VGYNIDSFGHGAYLPRFLCDAGIGSYTFMRPSPSERDLPANLFRWRSPDGAEVVGFRLRHPYATHGSDLGEQVENAIRHVGDHVDHTMCFFGVGDHGGGPTRRHIEWMLEHETAVDGARLVFSHPQAFFEAVAPLADTLPVVEGDIQHHAIGCYSVERRIKVGLRRAEARLGQATDVADALGADADDRAEIDRAWDDVLFNEFHDILCGTSLTEASRLAAGELVAAESTADRVIGRLTRRAFREQAEPGVHKILVVNPADRPFEGLVYHEPWLDFVRGDGAVEIRDETGNRLRWQRVAGESMVADSWGLLVPLTVSAGGHRVLVLEPAEQAPAAAEGSLWAEPGRLSDGETWAELAGGRATVNGWTLALQIADDPTDTWSHSAGNRHGGGGLEEIDFVREPEVLDNGPLCATLRTRGAVGSSRVWSRWMVCEGLPGLRLRLRVTWGEARRILRLRVDAPERITRRTDLVAGGALSRPVDGLEYPLNGGLRVTTGAGPLGVTAPEVFSVSVDPAGISLTLLRSPYAAHHDPAPADLVPDHPVCDQGEHEFDIVFRPGDVTTEALSLQRDRLLRPPVVWDLTG